MSYNYATINIVDKISAQGYYYEAVSHGTTMLIALKLCRAVEMVYKHRYSPNTRIKLTAYRSFFLSDLYYAHLVGRSKGAVSKNKLRILQKKAVRTVANVPYVYPWGSHCQKIEYIWRIWYSWAACNFYVQLCNKEQLSPISYCSAPITL